jgi:thioredoxin-dependent peroxiredoxin
MISVDDAETNARFAKEHEADFPILSNPTKDVGNAYGVLSGMGMARRWTFYIGTDGKILKIDKAVSTGSAGEDLARHLGELGVKRK